jgi:hypothetical protein
MAAHQILNLLGLGLQEPMIELGQPVERPEREEDGGNQQRSGVTAPHSPREFRARARIRSPYLLTKTVWVG